MTATKKHIPGKRIKTWHRAAMQPETGKANPPTYRSLKSFARDLLKFGGTDERETARHWLGIASDVQP